MLKIDFYESGQGETTIITFPNGGIGVVDAHPSPSGSRPDLLSLVDGKKIHFACMTHPHEDHALDLVTLLTKYPDTELWHTVPEVDQFVYSMGEMDNFPSAMQNVVLKLQKRAAKCIADIYFMVAEERMVHSNIATKNIDGVDIHFLGPDETVRTVTGC